MKIKLKDLTAEQWDKWEKENCPNIDCSNCPFNICNGGTRDSNYSWVNNKDMFSEKFLNQEIEIDTLTKK